MLSYTNIHRAQLLELVYSTVSIWFIEQTVGIFSIDFLICLKNIFLYSVIIKSPCTHFLLTEENGLAVKKPWYSFFHFNTWLSKFIKWHWTSLLPNQTSKSGIFLNVCIHLFFFLQQISVRSTLTLQHRLTKNYRTKISPIIIIIKTTH